MSRNKSEQLKFIVSKMLNDEQSEHSKMLEMLKKRLGSGKTFVDMKDILDIVHESKISVLETIYKEIQELE
jgi:hypothetical protein